MTLSIADAAREAKERLALVAGERRVSFAELAAHVARERAHWAALGIDAGTTTRAAFTATPSAKTIVRLLALFESGIAAVPLHVRLPEGERAALVARLAPCADLDALPPAMDDAQPPATPLPAAPPDDERPLAIVLTSGSSGAPKGAILARRAFAAAAAASAAHLGWREDDRWGLALPLAHVGGLSIVVRCLAGRRAVVLLPRFEPAAVAATLADERVTLLSLVPPMLRALLDLPAAHFPPPSLRALLLGGARLPRPLVDEARARGVPVLATYGMTETCAQVATERTPGGGLEPLPGVALRVVDGQIEVTSRALFSGYLGDDARPFTEDGAFRTQDRGEIDASGRLTVFGRADEIIITGGENVAPEAVEQALLGVPGVAEALVFGVPDERWGEIVAAALVARPGTVICDAGLARALAPRLAAHERPRAVAWLAGFPMTPSGKIDRAAARDLALPRLRPLAWG